MATEAIRVNGIDLSTVASNAESIAGLLRTPPRRGENISVPGGHGRLRRRHKLFDEADYALPMWIDGVDPVTGQPTDPYTSDAIYLQRLDELVTLFTADSVVLEHDMPDGTTRRAECEVIESLEPERTPGLRTFGRFAVALVNADAFWTETDVREQTFSDVRTGETLTCSAWDGSTAPLHQLIYTIGPSNNPELSQPLVGSYVAYDQVIGTGQKLIIDTTSWRLLPGDGTPWTPDFARFRHGGAKGNWFQLKPEPGGPKIIMTHEGGGTATLTVRGPRQFL